MAHSAACSSSASQYSLTRRSIAETFHSPHPPCTCTSHFLFAVARPLLKCRRLCNPSMICPLFKFSSNVNPLHQSSPSSIQSLNPVQQSSPSVQPSSPVHQSSPSVQSISPVHQSSPSIQSTIQSNNPVQQSSSQSSPVIRYDPSHCYFQ